MASQQTRREFLQDEPIQVHNVVPHAIVRSQVQQGLEALLEKVEIKAEASSSYDLGTIDRALATLRERRLTAIDPVPIDEEIRYLTDLRARTK